MRIRLLVALVLNLVGGCSVAPAAGDPRVVEATLLVVFALVVARRR
jgi:MYXO-CTERM domain-containing protein